MTAESTTGTLPDPAAPFAVVVDVPGGQAARAAYARLLRGRALVLELTDPAETADPAARAQARRAQEVAMRAIGMQCVRLAASAAGAPDATRFHAYVADAAELWLPAAIIDDARTRTACAGVAEAALATGTRMVLYMSLAEAQRRFSSAHRESVLSEFDQVLKDRLGEGSTAARLIRIQPSALATKQSMVAAHDPASANDIDDELSFELSGPAATALLAGPRAR
ncbi:hypothetical protein [Catellatospora sp. NPDC049609]|uniref:hypothetical protein n=1 Tax=Catellatospora sp. NPDC049609 TaxID=3155505 RepID=UPI00344584AE